MGIEISEEYGGSGASFFNSIITIEELSKVCPSVGVAVDLQNTLLNNLFKELGTKQQKDMYLPKLACEYVSWTFSYVVKINQWKTCR